MAPRFSGIDQDRARADDRSVERAPRRIRVLLVEDHEIVRQGLRLLLGTVSDVVVIGEAADGQGALRRAAEHRPDVVVLDVSMPEMNGFATLKALRAQNADVRVVALTRHAELAFATEMRNLGALGYVCKQSGSRELLAAIRAAWAGRPYIDASLTSPDAGLAGPRRRGPGAPHVASERETEVLRLTALGFGNKEIAARLSLSVKTVEVHKANGMRKLHLEGRSDVVRYAVLRGWLTDVDA